MEMVDWTFEFSNREPDIKHTMVFTVDFMLDVPSQAWIVLTHIYKTYLPIERKLLENEYILCIGGMGAPPPPIWLRFVLTTHKGSHG